jgi:hypothetical protein
MNMSPKYNEFCADTQLYLSTKTRDNVLSFQAAASILRQTPTFLFMEALYLLNRLFYFLLSSRPPVEDWTICTGTQNILRGKSSVRLGPGE